MGGTTIHPLPPPRDGHRDGARAAERAGLLDADDDAAGPGLLQEDLGDLAGQPLEEAVLRLPDELLDPLADGLVVEGVLDAVGPRGAAGVGEEGQVEDDLLADLPLPVEDADDGGGGESHDVDAIGGLVPHDGTDGNPRAKE